MEIIRDTGASKAPRKDRVVAALKIIAPWAARKFPTLYLDLSVEDIELATQIITASDAARLRSLHFRFLFRDGNEAGYDSYDELLDIMNLMRPPVEDSVEDLVFKVHMSKFDFWVEHHMPLWNLKRVKRIRLAWPPFAYRKDRGGPLE